MASAASLIESISRRRAQLADQPETRVRLERLQSWQVARLRRTYADYAGQKRYRDALEFFVTDLYGPHDYSQRNRDLSKVLHLMERLLSARAIETVIMALQLEALSQELDMAMVEFLTGDAIDEAGYADAYRRTGRAQDRQRQIDIIVTTGRTLDALARNSAIGTALRAARMPARVAGVLTLQTFLERGYRAFVVMKSAEHLLLAIEQRETAIMINLFAGHSDPFRWDAMPTRKAER